MDVYEMAKIIEAESSVLPYSGKLGVAQCIADNEYNAAAFTEPANYYSTDSLKAAKAVKEDGEKRFPDAQIFLLRSYTNYSDGNGNPDWEKLQNGRFPVPDDMDYLGTDCLDNKWGHFYFGKKESKINDFRMLVIAGHGEGDSGAIGCGYQEADLNREIAGLIKQAADRSGLPCDLADTKKNYYKYLKNGGTYDFTKYKYVLEMHFNASTITDYKGDGQMKGTMFFISEWEKGHSVEDKILANLYALGSKKAWDGVVLSTANYEGGLLVQNRVNQQGVSHGLLELCFISDLDDVTWYENNKERIAAAIVSGIITGFGLKNPVPDVPFNPYMVHIDIFDLNIRTGAGVNYAAVGKIPVGSYTIVEEKEGLFNATTGAMGKWGRLKSGAGWISLDVEGVSKV